MAYPKAKQINLNLNFTHYTNINSKQNTDLNVKQTIKLLKNNVGENLWNIGLREQFFNRIPKTAYIEEKTKLINWISSKLKTSAL